MSEILRAEHIVKIYGNGVMANKDINFSAEKGEIHAKWSRKIYIYEDALWYRTAK